MKYSNQHGLSLVELMVAITISLILSAAASYAYIAGIKNFSNTNGAGVLDQQAQFIMDLIGQNIRSAGTPSIDVSSTNKILDQVTTATIGPNNGTTYAQGLLGGCSSDANDNGELKWRWASNCADAKVNSALQVWYYADSNTQDCLGNALTSAGLVKNIFYVKYSSYVLNGQTRTIRELYCQGGSNAAQPLFRGVEQFNLTYGVGNGTAEGVANIKNVTQMSDVDWKNVASVIVCIVMRTDEQSQVSTAPVPKGCNGAAIDNPGKYVWKKYISTFNVRNRVTGRS